MNGFFLTHRKIFEHIIWRNVVDFRLFFLIYGNAVFNKKGLCVNGIFLKRGEWLRSYRKLQKDLEYKEKRGYKSYGIATIKRAVHRLIKNNLVTVRETEIGTVFMVTNYEKYQGFPAFNENNRNGNRNDNGTTTERYRNKNNKDNKGNNDNKNNYTSQSKLIYETHHLDLASFFASEIRKNNPDFKEPNLESWANTIRLMMERDNRSYEAIKQCIIWVQKHNFWYRIILSPYKLRKKYDQLVMEANSEKNKRKPGVMKGGSYEVHQSSYEQHSNRNLQNKSTF